ncbi:SemiSWEET family sugar transporter [Novispirillum sp. DQ9]|uniref:SemiSWEET family sugar transporter n=1 Tax=Novispirillum sp. DQ9 TaxID=3398612 RepID=UPI003C7C9949
MGGATLAGIIGTIAGLCTVTSFMPQLIKAWRLGDTEAISKKMYLVTVTGFCLWIAYGLLIGSLPILIFNSLSLLLSGAILALKLRNRQRGADQAR